ncbi:unnamed protein product, partial [Rotaria sp. Silwood2]
MLCSPTCRAYSITGMTTHSIPSILRSNITEYKRCMSEETYFQ